MLQTVTQQNIATNPGQGVPNDSESQNYRPWVKARLGPKDTDVQQIAANWKAQKRLGPNLAAAIRLWVALEAGDLDAARGICPALNIALGGESQRTSRARPPLKLESKDPEIPKLEGRKGEIARAISEVTGAPIQTNWERIDELSTRLILDGFDAADVYTWRDSVWRATWPGNKGEWPKLQDVAQGIGRKALPPVAAAATNTPPGATAQASGSSPAGSASRYLADAYFQNHDEPPIPLAEDPPARPSITSGRAYTWWVALLGQLKLQLGRSTYDTWLSGLRLVEVESDADGVEMFVALAPNQYAKDWIDKHLLMSASRTLSDLYQRPCGIRIELEESG